MSRKYRVVVRGANIQLALDGVPKLFGFYTHRFVKAVDEGEARRLALALIEKELRGRASPSTTGTFSVEEVTELDSFGDEMVPGKGFAFFPQEPPN